MRPTSDIHRAILERCDRGDGFAVALVVLAEGSTPCPAGTKAVVEATGRIVGTIGGGAVEAEARRRAVEAIRTGRAEVFDTALAGGSVAGGEPICGGRMRVLLDPTSARSREAYAGAVAARERRERGVLLTAIAGETSPPLTAINPPVSPAVAQGPPRRPTDPCTVRVRFVPEGAIAAEVGFPGAQALASALKYEEPECFTSDSSHPGPRTEVLVEPWIPGPRLLIVGGGHVGQAVARHAAWVGFELVVVDDRPEFTNPGSFPEGTVLRSGLVASELGAFPFHSDTYVVIVTRGHQHDAEALDLCLGQPAAYLGMIGSRRKVAMMRQEFVESGRATAEEFDRVHAPIGLDLGSVTVPEIATSIVAQMIAVRRKGRAPRFPKEAAT